MRNKCPGCTPSRRSSFSTGFTLLELLISLSIVGLILLIVFGALRIGSRAWEKGEKDVESHQRQRIVLDLMRQQLASAVQQEIEVEGEKPFFLKGDERSLAFTSRVAVVPENRIGTVFVQYSVQEEKGGEGEELRFYEKSSLFMGAGKGVEEPGEDDFILLIPQMEGLRFAYLKAPEKEGDEREWQDAWDPGEDKGMPLAVRITFMEGPGKPGIRVIAPIESESDKG